MSSEVDICNLALSHLGDEAGVVSIAPPDGTQQAAYCGTYYPTARDVLIEMHPWTFALKRAVLAEVVNPSLDWAYAYALPNTCVRPLAALYPGVAPKAFSSASDDSSFPYVVEADADGKPVLYTNVQTAVLRYIDKVTDTTKFPPTFVIALSRLLASYLAGPVIKGSSGVQVAEAQWKLFTIEFGKAAAANANTGHRDGYETRRPEFLLARGRKPWNNNGMGY